MRFNPWSFFAKIKRSPLLRKALRRGVAIVLTLVVATGVSLWVTSVRTGIPMRGILATLVDLTLRKNSVESYAVDNDVGSIGKGGVEQKWPAGPGQNETRVKTRTPLDEDQGEAPVETTKEETEKKRPEIGGTHGAAGSSEMSGSGSESGFRSGSAEPEVARNITKAEDGIESEGGVGGSPVFEDSVESDIASSGNEGQNGGQNGGQNQNDGQNGGQAKGQKEGQGSRNKGVTGSSTTVEAVALSDIEDLVQPVKGEVITKFGWVYFPAFKDWRFHPGLDFKASEGEPVRAVSDGTILAIEEDPFKGLVITQSYESTDVVIRYGGLAKPAVRAGDPVKAGGVLAEVGDPGLWEAKWGPHVHIEVRLGREGEAVDPTGLFR